ncbi:hypothetical protein F5887DRAFT_135882 [Amanita rubescens]|nr:hypothetical protein F5887DRAFT_135882 [Amanita rubescens]
MENVHQLFLAGIERDQPTARSALSCRRTQDPRYSLLAHTYTDDSRRTSAWEMSWCLRRRRVCLCLCLHHRLRHILPNFPEVKYVPVLQGQPGRSQSHRRSLRLPQPERLHHLSQTDRPSLPPMRQCLLRITLSWIPGQSGFAGNEETDESLAKEPPSLPNPTQDTDVDKETIAKHANGLLTLTYNILFHMVKGEKSDHTKTLK